MAPVASTGIRALPPEPVRRDPDATDAGALGPPPRVVLGLSLPGPVVSVVSVDLSGTVVEALGALPAAAGVPEALDRGAKGGVTGTASPTVVAVVEETVDPQMAVKSGSTPGAGSPGLPVPGSSNRHPSTSPVDTTPLAPAPAYCHDPEVP
jgi:hypothetical protein